MEKLLYRNEHAQKLIINLRQCRFCKVEWSYLKRVCVLSGLSGCGKTTLVFECFRDYNYFYFSFAGLGEEVAEALFAQRVSEKLGVVVTGWEDSIKAVSGGSIIIIFDDLASISTYKRFHKAFYDHMITDISKRPFVVLITQLTDTIDGLADMYSVVKIDYLTVRNIAKIFPYVPKFDLLGLHILSGGIPKILHDYDKDKPLADNIRNMLRPNSVFCKLMPELLARCFRRPENYHSILEAIANGNHSVSEIGKFTGFDYNKCDSYIDGLIKNGFIHTGRTISKHGTKKTAYILKNSYYTLWHRYIYRKRTELQLADDEVIDSIVQNVVEKEIHELHLEKAIKYVNKKLHSHEYIINFNITKKMTHNPYTVSDGSFQYIFDAAAGKGNKAVFVTVLKDPNDGCRRETLESIRKAVSLANIYFDSHVFIFVKRRVSDHAVKQASNDDVISLVRVEQLW